MKKITLLFVAAMALTTLSYGQTLYFDGSNTATASQVFLQGASWDPFAANASPVDDGTGNLVLQVVRNNTAPLAWHLLPFLDAGGGGAIAIIGSTTHPYVQLRIRTTKNGTAAVAGQYQSGTRTAEVTVNGGDGTNFGPWQTITLDFSSIAESNSRLELAIDNTITPTAAYTIQIDDIYLNTTLSTRDVSSKKLSIANPISNSIELGNSGTYTIYGLSGTEVKTGSYTKSINTENLNEGLYILKTSEGVAKFIKK